MSLTYPTTNTDFTLTMTDGANTVDGKSVGMDSDLTYNPSTNTLTAGTFSGSLVGAASSANQVLVTPELSSATTHFDNFSEQSTTPNRSTPRLQSCIHQVQTH